MPQSLQTEEQKRRRGYAPRPLDQRILRRTDRSGECWLWLGRLNYKGYGQMTVRKRSLAAHRVSYEAFVGPIPDGLEIDHLCRVRRCVNPQHLEAVTRSVNMQRAVAATGTVAGKRVGGIHLGEKCSNGHVVDKGNVAERGGLIRCLTCRREGNRLAASGGKPRQRSYTDHVKAAAAVRDGQGEWVLVMVARSASTAYHTVSWIKSGKKLPAYAPAGSFDAMHRPVDGGVEVLARFIGGAR